MVDLWPLVGIFMAVAIPSYVFFPNIVYSILTAMIIGAYSGHFTATNWPTIMGQAVNPAAGGSIIAIIALILAAMMFTTWFDNYRWLARYPTAFLMGTGLGVAFRALVSAQIIDLIDQSIVPLIADTALQSFSNIYFVLAFVFTFYYFLFGFDLKGPWRTLNRASRLFILMALGAQAANMTWNTGGRITSYLVIVDHINNFLASLA
jgi:hypothetical protein